MRISSNGDLVLNSTTARVYQGHTPRLSIQGTNFSQSTVAITSNSTGNDGAYLFFAKQKSGSVGGSTAVSDGTMVGQMRYLAGDGTDVESEVANITVNIDGTPGSNDTPGRITFATTNDGGNASTERMRITSAGHVRFGATSAIQSEKYTFFRAEADQNTLAYFHQGASSDVTGVIFRHGRALSGFNGKQIGFLRNDGTEVGSIVSGSSSTGYNTSSDYRLKENVTAISDGITRLKTLKPYRFNFKNDTTKPIVDGFFAHEVTAVPEAITGTKDQVDADNNPVYQQIDQSKLVPLLTAALQEAVAKIEVLETKVAALEAA
jgi:hypothetical protein